jgi:flagellar hook-associated protein 3 FlgL
MSLNRISSNTLYESTVAQLLRRQSELVDTQSQISSGRRVNTAADDPLAAGAALAIDRSLAELERFDLNANVLANRLNLQESNLAEAGESLQRIRELTIQAANAPLSASDRASIARELRQIRDGLLGIANGADAAGRYLFGGTQDDRPPFVDAAAGVTYVGDQTQRRIEVAPSLALQDAEPGSEVWMRVPTGDGRVRASALATNVGTGLLGTFGVVDGALWAAGGSVGYRIAFTSPTAYEIQDAGGAPLVPAQTGTFAPGDTITFEGLQLRLNGDPATGDVFVVEPAAPQDIFATIDALATALQTPATTVTERVRQQNAIFVGLSNISAAQDHFVDKRAAGGARLSGVDEAQALREATSVTLKSTLSDLRDVNVAEAASRLAQQSTALDAAQLSFQRISSLSLFNYLR